MPLSLENGNHEMIWSSVKRRAMQLEGRATGLTTTSTTSEKYGGFCTIVGDYLAVITFCFAQISTASI